MSSGGLREEGGRGKEAGRKLDLTDCGFETLPEEVREGLGGAGVRR